MKKVLPLLFGFSACGGLDASGTDWKVGAPMEAPSVSMQGPRIAVSYTQSDATTIQMFSKLYACPYTFEQSGMTKAAGSCVIATRTQASPLVYTIYDQVLLPAGSTGLFHLRGYCSGDSLTPAVVGTSETFLVRQAPGQVLSPHLNCVLAVNPAWVAPSGINACRPTP